MDYAILPCFFNVIMVSVLYPRQRNIALTLYLLTMVTNVWPPFMIPFMTEYGLSPGERFLVILRFLLTCSTVRGCFLDALPMVALMSLLTCSLYHLDSYKRDNILLKVYKGESRGGFTNLLHTLHGIGDLHA